MEKKSIKLRTRFLISVSLGVIALIVGFWFSWCSPSGDTPEKIKEVEATIAKEAESIGREEVFVIEGTNETIKFAPTAISWEKIKEAAKPLTHENKRIAKAKALKHCQENPIPDSSWEKYLWESRYTISSQDWNVQTLKSRISTSLGIAVLSCLGCIVGVFLLLVIANWMWYFLLHRISELSQAIQGK